MIFLLFRDNCCNSILRMEYMIHTDLAEIGDQRPIEDLLEECRFYCRIFQSSTYISSCKFIEHCNLPQKPSQNPSFISHRGEFLHHILDQLIVLLFVSDRPKGVVTARHVNVLFSKWLLLLLRAIQTSCFEAHFATHWWIPESWPNCVPEKLPFGSHRETR